MCAILTVCVRPSCKQHPISCRRDSNGHGARQSCGTLQAQEATQASKSDQGSTATGQRVAFARAYSQSLDDRSPTPASMWDGVARGGKHLHMLPQIAYSESRVRIRALFSSLSPYACYVALNVSGSSLQRCLLCVVTWGGLHPKACSPVWALHDWYTSTHAEYLDALQAEVYRLLRSAQICRT